jgi:hypothetical protein
MKSTCLSFRFLALTSVLSLFCLTATPSWAQTTTLISASSGGVPSNGFSEEATISPDGGFVVFHSRATNLVPNDTNGLDDDFIRDRVNGITERVSIASDGTEANGVSAEPRVSDGGHFIVFNSMATNLVAGDTNGNMDIFLRDRLAGTTQRVSLATGGVQANGYSGQADISADGRFVYFISSANNLVAGDTNGAFDVFVHDRTTGITNRVSVSTTGIQGNGLSRGDSISDDGRFASFRSEASNLVSGDGNGVSDAFVHDNVTGVTERVSVASDGSEANGYSGAGEMSADGRYVAFSSLAGNLVPDDTNGTWDCFVRDRLTGTTTRASVAADGGQSNGPNNFCGNIGPDGHTITFASDASNLVSGATTHVSQAYVRDTLANTTELVSVATDGQTANAASGGGGASADGRFILFQSNATNLYANDTNNSTDIFVRDRSTKPVANAGLDQAVNEGTNVALDGNGSSDSSNAAITYHWTQTGGPPVVLVEPTSPAPTFRSPFVATSQTLTFELTVTNALGNSSSDFVDISVIQYNDPPVAEAGPDGTVKEGAARMLDGSASYDPSGELIVDYQWGQVAGPAVTLNNSTTATPTFVAPVGTIGQAVTFALVVSDGKEPSDADTVTINIVENSPPTATAGADQTKDEGNAVTLDGTASRDPDIGDTISYSWQQAGGPAVTLTNSTSAAPHFTAPAVSSATTFTFALTVTDNDPITPKSNTDLVAINVRDSNAPPSCNLAVSSATKLWPPDHKMEAVSINGVSDTDTTYNNVILTITGVTQDEPINGTGDGDSSPDAMIANSNPRESVMIRRERAGNDDGRVYTVGFTASDGFESCNGTAKVTVPRSRNGTNAVDSGQTVNSTQP